MERYDATNPEHVRERKSREKLAQTDALDDLRAVLRTPEGRRIMWRLVNRAKVLDQTFVAGAPDLTAFNEGVRYAGRELVTNLEQAAPGTVLALAQENRKPDDE
jgi:hypothetical protein